MKLTIQNRSNENIVVLIEESVNPKWLVFIMHGLGWFKEQAHIETFAKVFKDNWYTVIRFDTTHSFWESWWNYEDATTTWYYNDLEDVISWASEQKYYKEPFVLVWHSLWAISSILYAEKYPEKIKALAPISTVVSGEMSLNTERYEGNDILEQWEKTWWRESISSTTWRVKRLKRSHIEDRLKYNVLDDVDKLIMPTLLIVWTEDDATPPDHQEVLFDQLKWPKEIHIIDGAPHTFKDKQDLEKIYWIFDKWINKIGS